MHQATCGTVALPLFYRLALVVVFLAACKADLEFDVLAARNELEGDKSETLFVECTLEGVNLFFSEQELSFTYRVVSVRLVRFLEGWDVCTEKEWYAMDNLHE